MQVFEFHFNPRLRPPFAKASAGKQGFGGQAKEPDLIFDSFCYEPENIYERRMGSLYLVGLLKNALPKNLRFLEKLQKVIKEKYYKSTILTPEKSLRESLKEANEFLEEIAKRGDVSWLGNLSFAVLALKNFKLNFTKVGEIKIFLLRAGKIIDIDKKLKFQDIEPYPLKIFGNIVSGKLAEGDLILVLTQEIFSAFAEGYGGFNIARSKASKSGDFFYEESILGKILSLTPFTETGLKDILNGKKEELSKISGVCLAISLRKEIGYPAKGWVGKREIILPKTSKEFSLKEVLSPFLKNFLRIIHTAFLQKGGAGLSELRIKLFGFLSPLFNLFKIKNIKSLILNKKLILILALALVLILGFIFSHLKK